MPTIIPALISNFEDNIQFKTFINVMLSRIMNVIIDAKGWIEDITHWTQQMIIKLPGDSWEFPPTFPVEWHQSRNQYKNRSTFPSISLPPIIYHTTNSVDYILYTLIKL